MTSNATNPLLNLGEAPDFNAIRTEHIAPAVDALIARCDQALSRVSAGDIAPSYKQLSVALVEPLEQLSQAWGIVSHLHGVVATPALRAAYAENQPKVTALYTRLSSNEALYVLNQRILQEDSELLANERVAIEKELTGLRLSGAELADAAKARFSDTSERLATLSRDFSNRLMDATDRFVHWATEDEGTGVTEDVVAAMRQAAQAEGKTGLKITLHAPCFGPVMQYADDRHLRERLYRANATRASEFGPTELDNGALIEEIVMLRQERSGLLGYADYAAVSLVPKMAKTAGQVQVFLRDLAQRSRPFAEKELAELRAFAADQLGLAELHAWDMAYASEKLRASRYAFSEQEVKEHFQLERVLSGMFKIAQTLFGITIVPDTRSVWHDTVTSYRVERDGIALGHFYLDPFARQGKRAGAWMNGAQARWRTPQDELRLPLAYLVTNFGEPAAGRPALLAHREVVTLFHEFGHGLHFLLTQVETLGVSGISGVEWDAVELPSQLMENYAWDWSVLRELTVHVETGAALPRALFDKMLAARNFQCGMALLRQVELALFDIRLHAERQQCERPQALIEEVRAEVSVLTTPDFNRFQNSFAHIFAGGYAAGYYSYLWAELLAADAWSEFEKLGPLEPQTGEKYLSSLLGRGGSRPMERNFVDFMGRPPQIDALLKQRGLVLEA